MADKEKNKMSEKGERIDKRTQKKMKKMEKKANRKPMNPVLKWVLITLCGFIAACCVTVCVIGVTMINHVISVRDGDSLINLDTYKNEQYQTSILYAFNDEGEKYEIKKLYGKEKRE